MIKRRTCDILTIVYILLVIVVFFVGNHIFMNTFVEKGLSGDYATIFNAFYISKIIISFLMGIYWLFILVLATNLHKKNLTKTIDLIVIILFIPLAPIFYLTNLRKSLKTFEKSNSTS